MKNIRTLALVLLVGFSLPAIAQQNFQLSSKQEFTVAGTSSLHDWEMTSYDGTGKAIIELDGPSIKAITLLKVQLPANSLKSGKSAMDKNAYEALNAGKHPNLIFELTEVVSISGQSIRANGKLTIAGTSKTITLNVNYRSTTNSIVFSGEFPISFSQFDLKAPTAVFGTIKTGNDLNISFETTFSKN